MAVSWYAVVTLAATVLGASITPEKEIGEKSICGRVWVTVHSPTVSQGLSRIYDAIELNWDFTGCASRPTQIGLFNHQPWNWNNAISVHRINSVRGLLVTATSLGSPVLPAGWEHGPGQWGRHCLWPWAGAGSVQPQISNCLKIQPTWMQDNVAWINRLRIGELAIAGSHNAGAWRFDTSLSQAHRDNFVLCQDRSIWAQLVYGIRYFDFRVGYYDSYAREDDRYWLNHNQVRVRALVPLLREIRRFLDVTNEIVFLDFHHFPVGFYNNNNVPLRNVHAGLLQIVQRELGPHIAPANEFGTGTGTRGPTVQTLLNARRRLVFNYIDNTIVAENRWLWPRVPHLWANTNNVNTLFQFLDWEIANSPRPNVPSPLFSAMAHTTPTALDIVLLRGSLRDNAFDVNGEATNRLETRWRQQANIVSTDFFLGNDIIEIAIILSRERGARRMAEASLRVSV